MVDSGELERAKIIGPDQKDQDRFNAPYIGPSIRAPRFLAGVGFMGANLALLASTETVLAQQVDQNQIAQRPQVYVEGGTQPLSASDQRAEDALLAQVNHRSGTIHATDQYNIVYVATAGEVMVDLLDNPLSAKQNAENWLRSQGLSDQAICNTAVFNLSGPYARQQAAILGPQFKLTPDACNVSPTQDTPPDATTNVTAGNTPDTDPVYKQSAAQGTQQMEATVDPLQMQARLILELPFQGSDFSLKYDFATNTFTKILRQGEEDQGEADFEDFLAEHNVDPSLIRHLDTVIAPSAN